MARDVREDQGQYYPGGKVIPRLPVPGGDGGNVKHGEFTGVSEIPDRFTIQQVKGKVNEVLNILKNAAVALAVCACGLQALSDVHTARLDELYNDATVVTNVTGTVTTNAVREMVAAATNATLGAANAYTDAAIQGSGSVTPAIVTNIVSTATTNIVTKTYVESLGISSGLKTNDVNGLIATATNGLATGASVQSLASTVADKRDKTDLSIVGSTLGDWKYTPSYIAAYNKLAWTERSHGLGWYLSGPQEVFVSSDANATELSYTGIGGTPSIVARRTALDSIAKRSDITNTVTKGYVESLGISSGVTSVNTKTGTVTLAASDVGAYSSNSGNQLAAQVATIGSYLNAEDAKFVVTNYNSETRLPEASVELKLPDQSWTTIWREMTRWNYLFDTYLPTNYASKAELAEKADRAWGYYDSHTGSYAPDGFTWISSPKIAIAADLAYQRTITAEGAVWVLESNGLVTETGGVTSNGFFRITDDEGNTQFEIVKGSTRTIGADASSCQVVPKVTPTKLQIGYSVVSAEHPTIYVCASLTNMLWKAETDADCLANVTWSGSSGAYVAQVQAKTVQPSLFVKAEYETGSESLIRNVLPVELTHVYLGGFKYAVSTNTISGHIVLTLTPSP